MHASFAPVVAKPFWMIVSQWFSSAFAGMFSSEQPRSIVMEQRVENIRALQRMARDIETSQPNLAAELRNFAGRA